MSPDLCNLAFVRLLLVYGLVSLVEAVGVLIFVLTRLRVILFELDFNVFHLQLVFTLASDALQWLLARLFDLIL